MPTVYAYNFGQIANDHSLNDQIAHGYVSPFSSHVSKAPTRAQYTQTPSAIQLSNPRIIRYNLPERAEPSRGQAFSASATPPLASDLWLAEEGSAGYPKGDSAVIRSPLPAESRSHAACLCRDNDSGEALAFVWRDKEKVDPIQSRRIYNMNSVFLFLFLLLFALMLLLVSFVLQ